MRCRGPVDLLGPCSGGHHAPAGAWWPVAIRRNAGYFLPLGRSGSVEGEHGFHLCRLRGGEEIAPGGVRLWVLHTSGHAPEDICLTFAAEWRGKLSFGR